MIREELWPICVLRGVDVDYRLHINLIDISLPCSIATLLSNAMYFSKLLVCEWYGRASWQYHTILD